MAETIKIDGRGMTIKDAIQDMWGRMQPLEARGFHPISNVEVVDAKKKKVVEVYELTDPEFQAHLDSDKPKNSKPAGQRLDARPHKPETKERYDYIARISLEL